MPTSPTGSDSGFTLVELMVVVAIIGMAAGAVVMSMPSGDGAVRSAAEKLAARTTVARDLAIVDGRATILVVNSDGYTFAQRSGGVMRPLEQRGLRQAALPEGMRAMLGNRSAGEVRFDPTGLADPATVMLTSGGTSATVRIAADGSVNVEG
ncbi:GspH/FimT family pseudopilin [Sphingomonas gilva]|nr:GspH/FimT family pseudopilin [Sphingomonas gilva]